VKFEDGDGAGEFLQEAGNGGGCLAESPGEGYDEYDAVMDLPAYDQSAAIRLQFMMPAWLFGKKPYDASLAKSTLANKSVTPGPPPHP
jgi:hypothetical protein